MAALFWARSAERYLKPDCTIAFVLPYAAINRPAFAGVRRGEFSTVQVRVVEAWDLARVRPIFGGAIGTTSTCVLFGRREPAAPLPAQAEQFVGTLPRRDASEAEADALLRRVRQPWPAITTLEGASVYRSRFKQGANIVPRRFFFVEREPAARLGDNPASPRVHGRIGALDRMPWREIEPPRGAVEAQFLRTVLLGENIAPYRVLTTALAVIPVESGALLDSAAAAAGGHRHLAAWLRDIERKWRAHCGKRADGTPRLILTQQLDHMRKLSIQLSASGLKVVYTKAGTLLSAAILDDPNVVIDHKAYWAVTRSIEEARYLVVVLNSATVLARIIPMQPRGWRDPRDFDNLVWELPIPEFDRRLTLHRELADAAAEAEQVAALVPLREGAHFMRQRRAIRDALAAHGIASEIDKLVIKLLDR
jgi:hypothetical protein